MADKKSLYEAAQQAGLELPDYDDITGKELEALLSGSDGGKDERAGESGLKVTNLRNNPQRVAGHVVEPKGSITLTDAEMSNEGLVAKLEHAERTGALKLG